MNYDKTFISFDDALAASERRGEAPCALTIERSGGVVFPYLFHAGSYEAIKKMALLLMWMVGGERLVFSGDKAVYDDFAKRFAEDEEAARSIQEMTRMFSVPFEVSYSDVIPERRDDFVKAGGDWGGCRIGIDLGGSDRKATAVIDGKAVFSDETLWLPKAQTDWHYHYDGIRDSFLKAKAHLPRVDAVGISTAGVVIDDRFAQAALCAAVPEEDIKAHIEDIFLTLRENEFPGVPMKVANDGAVSALSGPLLFHRDRMLGLAMGTSEATGYCEGGAFNGWFMELGKAPFNLAPFAATHYSMGIKGSGSEYLSQKGILRLAEEAGYRYQGTLAEQLLALQRDAEAGEDKVLACYEDMGEYLASAIKIYSRFLPFDSVLLLGRVLTGKGGDLLVNKANAILKESGLHIEAFTADESFKRLGQAYLAAALPKID